MKRTLYVLIAFACAFVCSIGMLAPAEHAHAASAEYTIDHIATDLYVETDASVHIIERHVLTFSSSNKGYIWYLHEPEECESVKISSIRAARVDAEGALSEDWTVLQLVDSDPSAQGARPGDTCNESLRADGVQPWYSYRISDGYVRCYFPASDGTYLIETDYTVVNRVSVFRDVGELYWRYAQSDMPIDAHDVTLRVAIPIPAGSEIVPGTTVLAWGHGPSDGSFTIGEDGLVAFHADVVQAGHYAEAHIIFPAHWIENIDRNSPKRHSEARRAAAIDEEANWLDESARSSIWDNKVRVLFAVIDVLAVIVALGIALKCGRSARSRRWLIRVAATVAIVALAEQAFFAEPVTTTFLLVTAAGIAVVALFQPRSDECEGGVLAESAAESAADGDADGGVVDEGVEDDGVVGGDQNATDEDSQAQRGSDDQE